MENAVRTLYYQFTKCLFMSLTSLISYKIKSYNKLCFIKVSREDAAKEGYKVLKRCATFFEKAGGCECALNEPECKGTTVDALIPDGCMEMGQQMMLYCYSRKGKSVFQMNDIAIELYSYSSKHYFLHLWFYSGSLFTKIRDL